MSNHFETTPRILKLIATEPMTVAQIAAAMGVPEKAMYMKMSRMEKSGLAYRCKMKPGSKINFWIKGREPENPGLTTIVMCEVRKLKGAFSAAALSRSLGHSHRSIIEALYTLRDDGKVYKVAAGWKFGQGRTINEFAEARSKAELNIPKPGHKATPWDGLLLRL